MTDHDAQVAYLRDFRAQAEDCAHHLRCTRKGLKKWLRSKGCDATDEKIGRYLTFMHFDTCMEVHWLEPDFRGPFACPSFLGFFDPREPFRPRTQGVAPRPTKKQNKPTRKDRLAVEGNLFGDFTNPKSKHDDRG